jgi:hypothetical protein
VTSLNYLPDDPNRLVTLRLPNFVDQFYHLPNRILDLLELAAYVFAADRATFRGAKDAVEYHAWPRTMFRHEGAGRRFLESDTSEGETEQGRPFHDRGLRVHV